MFPGSLPPGRRGLPGTLASTAAVALGFVLLAAPCHAQAGPASPGGGPGSARRPATEDASIRPFRVHVPEADLADLRRRIAATRQGGDWGAGVVEAMGRQAPAGLLGIHTNLPAVITPEVGAALGGGPIPEAFSAQERAAIADFRAYLGNGGLSYLAMMGARPQAVGYGLTDSPAGLAGWMLVHGGFAKWTYGTDPTQSPTRDDVLDDFSLYWLTNTSASAARLYWENRNLNLTSVAAQKTSEISVPVAITVFPDEVIRAQEPWARRAFPTLGYFHEADRGGHFAMWEHPELFAAELRAAFKPLR